MAIGDGGAAGPGQAGAARRLAEALGLETPPVALAFVDDAPAGLPTFSGEVPSACAFWREAERGTFYASAAQHAGCAVGAHVLGLSSGDDHADELQAAIERMFSCGYLGEDEPDRIPTVPRAAAGVVYGPLADLPVRADLVVVWVRPSQAMLLQEAVGGAAWSGGSGASLIGRPGCAALPLALGGRRSTLSAGCIGMRTFTEVSGDLLLAALPGGELEDLAERLERARQANDAMQAYYEERRRAVGAGSDAS